MNISERTMEAYLVDAVTAIIDEAAAAAILPRFNRLHTTEIEEKTPGEVVTTADRDAEWIISRQLAGLVPGSRVVGEEAAAQNPSVLDQLDEGDVWLVDPLDGTANFVAGSPDFAVMVAFLRNGLTMASWMLAPLSHRLAIAVRGQGATLNGDRVKVTSAPQTLSKCRGAVLTRFLPEEMKNSLFAGKDEFAELLPGRRCSGIDYPSLVAGEQDFLMFWRLLPWDHAPGVLFAEEAGGVVARLEGSKYLPGDQQPGLLIARDPEVWRSVHRLLTGQASLR
jgi:fructose-1,6-bisphosphatase/inositol monophosphatase family enzyme